MVYFVIAGKPDCPLFVHAAHVASYLEDHLPNFHIKIIQKKTGKWERWLEKTNGENKWYHCSSPLIWKELALRGGKPHLIGGISEFWEYCYDYYGLESVIAREDLEKMVADNMQYFQEMENAEKGRNKNILNISITGASNPLIVTLIPEILQLRDLPLYDGLSLKLFDEDSDVQDVQTYLLDLITNIRQMTSENFMKKVSVVNTLKDTLIECDLLILIDDYSCKMTEEENDWLVRNISCMYLLADEINAFAKRTLRVVLAINGPVCFNATALADACTQIKIQNIAAVTSDVGLAPLTIISKETGVPVQEMGAPPVWGFIGLNSFVDIGSIIKRSDIYRPYLRAVRTNSGSTLPLGKIKSELRFMAYLTNDIRDIWPKVKEAKDIIQNRLNRPPTFAKARAIVNLLKLWYAKEPSDEIISLGVCSNGAYGFPSGVVYSQPVTLENKVWTPFKDFPLTEKSKIQIEKLIPSIMDLLEDFCLGPNYSCKCEIPDFVIQ